MSSLNFLNLEFFIFFFGVKFISLLVEFECDAHVGRLGNSDRRVGFVSTRLTRLHNRARHEPDPIINRVEILNPNTTHLQAVLLEHDPGNTFTFNQTLKSESLIDQRSRELRTQCLSKQNQYKR
jgi:hypothetical protein